MSRYRKDILPREVPHKKKHCRCENDKGVSRFTVFLLIVLTCCLSLPSGIRSIRAADSKTYTASQKDLDIMFVIDYSNSMNSNDKDKVALQMIEACIDSLFTSKMRVGFVAYNDTILSYQQPTSITSRNSREKLKRKISAIPRSGSTDIGLALKKAEELLRQGNSDAKRSAHIILLSDGEPDLTYSKTGRTIGQCYNDMDSTAARCKEAGIPIDTIAFGAQFGGKTSALLKLSDTTNGAMNTAKTPDVLIDIFGEIIKKYTISSLRPISVGISAGKTQTIELPTKGTYAEEANILVVSSKPLNDATIIYSGTDISYAKSGFYFTSKIRKPIDENIKLQVKGQKNQEIKIYLLLYNNITLNVEMPKQAAKNNNFVYRYFFTDSKTKKPIGNEAFYDQFSVQITGTESALKDKAEAKKAGEEAAAQMNKDAVFVDNKMEVTAKLKNTGEYKFDIELKADNYKMGRKNIVLKVANQAPIGNFEPKLDFVRLNKEKSYYMAEYFSDPNDDELRYELVVVSGEASENIKLEENILTINPKLAGDTEFFIRVTDSEDAVYESELTHVYVEPLWKHYLGVIIGLAIVIVMLIIYFLWLAAKRRKVRHIQYEAAELVPDMEINTSFAGKLNAYFTKLPDELEIEPLTFTLYQIKEKTVTLGQLLESVDAPVQELDADNICFKASHDKELILYHTSKSSVMVGPSVICKKLKYSIDYGSKIYITSQDEEYELELHYVSIRS